MRKSIAAAVIAASAAISGCGQVHAEDGGADRFAQLPGRQLSADRSRRSV